MKGANGVSVVVPVYNSAATLEELVRRVREVVSDRPLEIVLVDDWSTDGSRALLGRLGVRTVAHTRNRGQNAAILSGLTVASQPLSCVIDADLEDPPESIAQLLAPLDAAQAQVVFAGRVETRRASSRVFRWAIQRLFPSLPAHPCLCFAIDAAGRAALVRVGRDDDYLPALIGALGLSSTQAVTTRGVRPAHAGASAYGRVKRVRYAATMLGAALRVWWRRPVAS
jgi:glycosyltransferase involved in cell wall biosynthesis